MQRSGQWQAQEVGEGADQGLVGEMVLGEEGVRGVQGRRRLDGEKVHSAGEVCCRSGSDLGHKLYMLARLSAMCMLADKCTLFYAAGMGDAQFQGAICSSGM